MAPPVPLTSHRLADPGERRDSCEVGDRRRPLILAYHAVDSAWSSPLAVSEAGLDAHASYLHERGFVGLTLSQQHAARPARYPRGRRLHVR